MKSYKNLKKNIQLPFNIEIKNKDNILNFSGPLGFSMIDLKKIDKEGVGAIGFCQKSHSLFISSHSKSFFGCISKLIENKINGITRGFLISLRIIGIGYRVQLQNQSLILKVGFSHDLKYELPLSVRAFLLEPTLICFYGIDKNQLTQTVAKIKKLKPPSPYKGKGLCFSNEVVSLKVGKRK